MRKKLFKRSVWTMFTIFFAFIFVIVLVAEQIAEGYTDWVDGYFGIGSRYILENNEDGEEDDAQYYISDYAVRDENGDLVLTTDDSGVKHQVLDSEAISAHSLEVSMQVAEEGSVLLWNNKSALPLSKGDKITTFGFPTEEWYYSGTGSGRTYIDVEPNVNESLGKEFTVNPSIASVYSYYKRLGYGIGNSNIREVNWSELDKRISGGVEASVAQYGDAAIFFASRINGEGSDATAWNSAADDGSMLSFSRDEVDVLQNLAQLKSSGKIKKLILVLNTANAMNLGYIKDIDIDACLWVGYGGNVSTEALTHLLVGSANPSGHLPEAWLYDLRSAPANQNFGHFSFTESPGVPEGFDDYVVYQEGIYVGYLYYETRYEDTVIGGRNADSTAGVVFGGGKWNYSDELAYTLGHGESYTTFEYSRYSVRKSGTDYVVSMTIKNTGNVAGKEVMQIYLQKPYTEYDVKNKVEKAAVQLVGFNKTKLLAPGEEETLTVTVSEYEFKSYDAYGEGTYILEKGDYYLAAGRNAHDALNNILTAKGYSTSNGMDYDGIKNLAYKATYSHDDFETYSVSPAGYKITNQFNDADINLYAGTANQKITYLSRSNWSDTYPSPVTLTCTDATFIKDMQFDREVINNPEDEMPIYDTVTSEYGALNLIQLMDLPFDDPLWEDLLNQMSVEEQLAFVRSAQAGAISINAPGGHNYDGPNGIAGRIYTGTSFPCEPILTATFNLELIEAMGRAFGMEMMRVNIVGLYGLGANIHRSALGGRNMEYYSEDGFLSSVVNSAESKGMRSMGIVMYTKHFALNDQDTNRGDGVTTWANEQSIREIYLKAFETSVLDGNSNGFMTSFNRIGATWSSLHKGLLTEVARGEWGFKGIFLTDAGGEVANPYMGNSEHTSVFAAAVIAGQTTWLSNIKSDSLDAYRNNATLMKAVREGAHYTLYIRLQSYAINGLTSSTRVVYVQPAWEKVITTVEVISGILAGACLLMTAAAWFFWVQDKRKEK